LLLGFQKLALNYLASLKIEMTKIADTQQEILTFIQTNNVVSNTSQCLSGMQMDHEVDYFISNWPLSDMDNLLSMEQKIKSDQNFRKQVVCITLFHKEKLMFTYIIKFCYRYVNYPELAANHFKI